MLFTLHYDQSFFSVSLFFGSHIIQRQKEPAKAHQIKLDVVVKALKWLEIDVDMDEVF
jgi:hypothetical protein